MAKGNIVDILVIILIIFVASFSMILSGTIASIANNTMSSSHMPGINVTHINRATSAVYGMDIAVAAMFFGALMASVISAYYIGTHPFFFIFSVVFLLIMFVIAGTLANTFNDIVEGSTLLAGVGTNMPYTMFMGRMLPYEALIAFVLIGIALYAGKGSGNEIGGGGY
jgi:hypothetical protein